MTLAPTCPICSRAAAADGRVDLVRRRAEHTQGPVGGAECLETPWRRGAAGGRARERNRVLEVVDAGAPAARCTQRAPD